MKKQYIKPVVDVIDIETEQLMAASPNGVRVTGDDGDGFLNDTQATKGGSAMSKGHNFDLWADDED